MKTWIFQGNPERFDIEGYLRACRGELSWLVTRYADQIAVEDTVFLWRSGGKGKGSAAAGIFAECRVIEAARERLDDELAMPYWNDPEARTAVEPRARLLLVRLANQKEFLKREWLEDDSVLREMLIIRQPAGTNFPVSAPEARRLYALWGKTGTDWTWDEVIAAMYLYETSRGQQVSKSPGSPVEQMAQTIGRAPSGVYNKLMNLRALDPRAPQGCSAQRGACDR